MKNKRTKYKTIPYGVPRLKHTDNPGPDQQSIGVTASKSSSRPLSNANKSLRRSFKKRARRKGKNSVF